MLSAIVKKCRYQWNMSFQSHRVCTLAYSTDHLISWVGRKKTQKENWECKKVLSHLISSSVEQITGNYRASKLIRICFCSSFNGCLMVKKISTLSAGSELLSNTISIWKGLKITFGHLSNSWRDWFRKTGNCIDHLRNQLGKVYKKIAITKVCILCNGLEVETSVLIHSRPSQLADLIFTILSEYKQDISRNYHNKSCNWILRGEIRHQRLYICASVENLIFDRVKVQEEQGRPLRAFANFKRFCQSAPPQLNSNWWSGKGKSVPTKSGQSTLTDSVFTSPIFTICATNSGATCLRNNIGTGAKFWAKNCPKKHEIKMLYLNDHYRSFPMSQWCWQLVLASDGEYFGGKNYYQCCSRRNWQNFPTQELMRLGKISR